MKNKEYYISIEIGGTNLRYSIIDNELNIIYFNKIKTKDFSDAYDKIEYLSKNIIDDIMSKYKIKAISFSLASLLDKTRRIAQSSPMINNFENVELADIFEKKYNIDVFLQKDVNSLLLYDINKNHLDKNGIIVGIYLGTGLGNAIAIDGKIHYGFSGGSAELGHIPALGCYNKCDCGKTGCIETLVSGRKLEQIANNHNIKDISSIFNYFDDIEELKDFVRYFAIAVATEISILDPNAVIIGGGVPVMKNFPLDFFENEVKNNLRAPNPRNNINIIYSDNDINAGVIGSIISVLGL
ncbi:allose kinase [Brachyspira pilosicoli]|uniref:allose kinase n=2 Tax=Brachyspira pilosicoli TaxID=52584 RepID=UPI0012F51EFB|nr:allose kinase [Brachyspira pilosicoli]